MRASGGCCAGGHLCEAHSAVAPWTQCHRHLSLLTKFPFPFTISQHTPTFESCHAPRLKPVVSNKNERIALPWKPTITYETVKGVLSLYHFWSGLTFPLIHCPFLKKQLSPAFPAPSLLASGQVPAVLLRVSPKGRLFVLA